MAAALTQLRPRGEQLLTFVAGPPHALSRFLVHEVLSTHFAGSLQNIDLSSIEVVVGNNGSSLSLCLEDGSPLLTTGNDLGLRAPGWVADTFGASNVVAAGALLAHVEVCAALVAGLSYTHTDGLVHAQDGVVGVY